MLIQGKYVTLSQFSVVILIDDLQC